MSSEWPTFSLENCLDALIDYRGKTPEKTTSGIPLITAKIIKNGRIETPTEFIAADNYDEWMRRGIPEPGDVVLTVEAPLGEVAQLGPEKVALAQRVVTLRGKRNFLNSTYLLYWLQSEEAKEKLIARASGTTVIGIKQSELRKIQLRVPPYEFQVAAAAILKNIDDRITLLRETNKTLESIAQAIFKSWFVDFDPVRAKMEGRQPEGMDEDTAALFPDSFEESELGLVPRGWHVATMSEVAEVIKGKSYSSKDLVVEHDTALVTLKSFLRGGGFRMDGFKPYAGAYKPNQIVEAGDLIIAYTDVTQAAELVGRPAIVVSVDEYRTLVASLDVGIVRPKTEKLGQHFLYEVLRTDSFLSHALAHTSGTTVLHLAKNAVSKYSFPCPSNGLIRTYETVSGALRKRQQLNNDEMRVIEALRDALLPRLISGRLRLSLVASEVESICQ